MHIGDPYGALKGVAGGAAAAKHRDQLASDGRQGLPTARQLHLREGGAFEISRNL